MNTIFYEVLYEDTRNIEFNYFNGLMAHLKAEYSAFIYFGSRVC